MIQIGALIQGTLSSNNNASGIKAQTTIPELTFSDNLWKSSVRPVGVYTGEPINSYSSDAISYTTEISITAANRELRPTLFGAGLVAFQGGIWIYSRNGDEDWINQSLSSIPGANVGGGTIAYIVFINGYFLIQKSGSSYVDICLTQDFSSYIFPSGGLNSVREVYSIVPFTTRYANSVYVAFFDDEVAKEIRVATSSDLITWSDNATVLPSATNVTSQGARSRAYSKYIAHFSGRFYIFYSDYPDGADNLKVLRIWRSADCVSWTEMAVTNSIGNEGIKWYVTTTAIELVTATHNFRSVNGISWVETVPQNRLPKVCSARGDAAGIEAPPSFIAFPYGTIIQDGGKVLSFSAMNSSPELKYPEGANTGIIVGWVLPKENTSSQEPEGLYDLNNDGFTLTAASFGTYESNEAWSLYCRNTSAYYFEVAVDAIAPSGSQVVGVKSIGDTYYNGALETSVLLGTNTIYLNRGDVAISYTFTSGTVLGFLMDFDAQTITITVDGVTLYVATSIEPARGWQAYMDIDNGSGSFTINVGQDVFLYNATGATALMVY